MRANPPRRDRSLVTQFARDGTLSPVAGGGHVNGMPGQTNGVANGRGRTNGLTNGLTNGTGRTNGFTNGVRARTRTVGYVNGLRLHRNQAGVVYPSDTRRSGVILAASVVFMLVAGYVFGTPPPVPSPYQIDGNFSDWANVHTYPDPIAAMPADADLVAFAVAAYGGDVFAYARMRGPLFPNSEPSSLFVLIDDPTVPGYHVPGMDANFVVELWGWNSTLEGSRLWEWSGGSDADNASALRAAGDVPAASSGREVELRIPGWLLSVRSISDLRFRVSSWSAGWSDSGMLAGVLPGAVVVTQHPLTDAIAARSNVLQVRFSAFGSDVVIRNLTVDHAGGGAVGLPSLPLLVPAGQDRVANLSLDPAGMLPGNLTTLRITDVQATAANETRAVPATIDGPSTRVYSGSVPLGYRVDGLFSEWTNVTPDPNDGLPGPVDIRRTASALPNDAFFYVQTEGDILAGAILPKAPTKPVPSSGNGTPQPPVPLPAVRIAAEDVLRIYVDVDNRDAAGYPIGGMFADRLLEAHGRNQRITSRALYTWDASSGTWTLGPGTPDVAFEGTQLEARMPSAFLGTTYGPRVVFETTDWSGAGDLAGLAIALAPVLAASGVQPLHGTGADSIAATLLTNTPTVDGLCPTSPTEYVGATVFVGSNLTFSVGRRDDTQYLYVCIRATADVTANKFDTAWIMFDRNHDGGTAPRTDDRQFSVDHTQSYAAMAGTGTGWTTCGAACDPGDSGANTYTGGIEQYEFRVRYSDTWGNNTPTPGSVAGFAIVVLDRQTFTFYRWGSTAVNENVPDTWGHLVLPIPEFPVPLAAVSTFIGVVAFRRRRRTRSR